ncbi:hypothetical protein ONZ43_g6550 [Nemania bipapillata]|uniref:Uncharacterized protein n=1 Tax=Nemania bipapillata TaxID=110536 RepID=A0ACC2HYD7_9PEZI|nr:hypothetical protein ONZ43_g6550 [Nemania bipapillata]
MRQSILAPLALALEARTKVLVPELTGPYQVGTTVLELVDYSRQDPFAPTPQPRDLVVSLFYPTGGHSKHVKNCSLAPQFPPGTAAALDMLINQTAVVESLTTRSCNNSPLSWPDLPLLLVGPGLGTTRLLYSDIAEELASYGWNLVTIDHPYDSLVVEYPDGRLVLASDSPNAANATLEQYLDVRVKDTIFVLDSLANSSVVSQIPGLGGSYSPRNSPKPKLKTAKLLKDDKRFFAGSDLDGGVYGDVVQEGTDSPFLYMRAQNHTHIDDPTWAEAWPNLRGFKREYSVNDTTHGSFTDLPVFRDLLGEDTLGVYGQNLGSNTGARLLKIQAAFLGAFFDRFLKGRGGDLLDGKGMSNWPEVTLELEN